MRPQQTIKSECRLSGKGLFSGQDAKVLFRPADENSGIVFVRTDVEPAVEIPARIENVASVSRRTSLTKKSTTIDTIEHCLAAVHALQIDNLIIEIQGSELPAPDSSCMDYFKVLKKAGRVEQTQSCNELIVRDPITIKSDGAWIYALPGEENELNITYDLDYSGHTGIGRQIYGSRITPEGFEKNLAGARTFLLEAEALQFQAQGIGTHLSAKDILVINSDGPVKNAYRFDNECVRHKIVDLIGDLALLGRPIQGRIVAYRSGHSLNQQLVTKLIEADKRQKKPAKPTTDIVLDIRQISRTLPHRYPFLLVDKVTEIEGNRRIKGIKNVTFNEQFFQGHFPGTPIMPGVLILEALAQISGLLFAQTLEHTGKLAVLLSMDGVKLRRAVVPGDQLILIAESVRSRKRTAQCKCVAMVGEVVAAEAEIKFMLIDDEKIHY